MGLLSPLEPKKKIMVLPNQMHSDDNKALGLDYDLKDDKLCVITSHFLKKKKENETLSEFFTRASRNPNTKSTDKLLSQILGVNDPVGLVTPANHMVAILVHRAFQKGKDGRVPVSESWVMLNHQACGVQSKTDCIRPQRRRCQSRDVWNRVCITAAEVL